MKTTGYFVHVMCDIVKRMSSSDYGENVIFSEELCQLCLLLLLISNQLCLRLFIKNSFQFKCQWHIFPSVVMNVKIKRLLLKQSVLA